MLAEIPIQPQWVSDATEFAHASIASRRGYLASRGQFNQQKILDDIVNGAVAEFAVAWWFEHTQGATCSKPDLAVYTGRKKSWAADLQLGDQKIHVKTFSNPKWSSWVFTYYEDKGDPLVDEPSPDDYLALTQVDTTTNCVRLHYFVRAGRVINLYRPPLLKHLQHSKLVLDPADLDRLVTA